jgi:glycosyltransferase involved in cell wall biosynthesis
MSNPTPVKVLVFAHVPPPHHGQSYMVQLMLSGLGGDRRKVKTSGSAADSNPFHVLCYHVDARISKKLEDIGDLRFGKFLLLLGYCLQAIWCRFRYGVEVFYYVPAPGKRSALYRDWLVMFLCRPFFKRVILHWHAAGLAKWLETMVRIRSRAITYNLMKQADLSIVLSRYNRADAEKLFPRHIQVVSNGILDPCPQFERDVLPRRRARAAATARLMAGKKSAEAEPPPAGEAPFVFNILYLAHCMRDKGLFDAVAGVQLASQKLAAQSSPVTLHLKVAGNFVTTEEKAEFDQLLKQPGAADLVEYLGFVSGTQKEQLLRESDLLCFPTYYQNENQPVNLIEAMAFGLPIITTHWRSLPEMFPKDYPGLVDVRSPGQIADSILQLLTAEAGGGLRQIFVQNFTLERYLAGLAEAFRSVEKPDAPALCASPQGAEA